MSNLSRIYSMTILLAFFLTTEGSAFAAGVGFPPEDIRLSPDLESSTSLASRPTEWAQPAAIEGVPNCFKVTDNLYRGAQPTAEGMRNLQKRGIKTIVNLRAYHSDRDEIGDLPLDYVHIKIKTWDANENQIVEFLKVASDPSRQPVFVHCQHGADRTGTMCAVYRIAVQGWTKDEAIREMTEGGYEFHAIWDNLIELIQNLDIAKICKNAGLPEPPNTMHKKKTD